MRRFMLALVVVGIVGYGAFEARRLIEGPLISIDSPRDHSATSTQAVLLSGKAENISFLTINDKPAYTDEAGHFVELLSLPSGSTVLTVAATDRFGRKVSKSVLVNVLNYCSLI